MNDPVIIVLVSVGLAVLAMLYAIIMWNSRHSSRYLLRAVGIIMLIVGLFITGISQLMLNGVRSFIDWLNRTYLDTTMWIGIGLGVVGILAFLIGGFITPPTRAEAKLARLEREDKQRANLAAQAAKEAAKHPKQPTVTKEPATTVPPPLPKTEPVTGTADDEVASILKKHGIE